MVIVTHNSACHILECIRTLEVALHTLRHEIVVVDNASTDNTVDLLRQSGVNVTLIENPVNAGFSVACNQGQRAGRGSDWILFLNPDTAYLSGDLVGLICEYRDKSSVGIVGVKLVQADGRLDHACKRNLPTPSSSFAYFASPRKRAKAMDKLSYTAPDLHEDEVGEVGAVNGAFMLIPCDVLTQVGGWDEEYWMYMEDLDLCKRVHGLGLSVIYDPRVTFFHKKGGSNRATRRSWPLNKAFHKSMWLYYRKNLAGDYWKVADWIIYLAIAARMVLVGLRDAILA